MSPYAQDTHFAFTPAARLRHRSAASRSLLFTHAASVARLLWNPPFLTRAHHLSVMVDSCLTSTVCVCVCELQWMISIVIEYFNTMYPLTLVPKSKTRVMLQSFVLLRAYMIEFFCYHRWHRKCGSIVKHPSLVTQNMFCPREVPHLYKIKELIGLTEESVSLTQSQFYRHIPSSTVTPEMTCLRRVPCTIRFSVTE